MLPTECDQELGEPSMEFGFWYITLDSVKGGSYRPGASTDMMEKMPFLEAAASLFDP